MTSHSLSSRTPEAIWDLCEARLGQRDSGFLALLGPGMTKNRSKCG